MLLKGGIRKATWHRRFLSSHSEQCIEIAQIAPKHQKQELNKSGGSDDVLPSALNLNPIVQILGEHLQLTTLQMKGSLYLLKCPTGIGKTFATVVQLFNHLKKCVSGEQELKRIYFVTDLLDNVNDALANLEKMIENDEQSSSQEKVKMKKQIVTLPSQQDIILRLNEKQLNDILELLDVSSKKYLQQRFSIVKSSAENFDSNKARLPLTHIKVIENSISEDAGKLYGTLMSALRQKIKLSPFLLENESFIYKVSCLVPGALLKAEFASVAFLTTKKLLSGYDTLKYRFKPLIAESGAIFFIDEFDKQSKVVLDYLIQAKPIDLIKTVKDINSQLTTHYFEATDQFEGISDCFEAVREFSEVLSKHWHVQQPIGIDSELWSASEKNVTLFSDKITIHTASINGKLYIGFDSESEKSKVSLHKFDGSRSLQGFIKQANQYCNSTFPQACLAASNILIKNEGDESSTQNEACYRVLRNINLEHLTPHITDRFHFSPVRKNKSAKGTPFSYHTRGLKLTELIVPERDKYTITAMHHSYEISPTAILADLVIQGNDVIGISATAESESVLHNFDLSFLRRVIGEERYIEPSRENLDKVASYYHQKRNYVANGIEQQVSFHDVDYQYLCDEIIRQFGPDSLVENIIRELAGLEQNQSPNHAVNWISKVLKAIQAFINNPHQRYMVSLLSRGVTRPVLIGFLSKYVENLSLSNAVGAKLFCGVNARYLREQYQQNVIKVLEKDPCKVIVFSTYATMGAGTNIDYIFDPKIEFSQPINVDDCSNTEQKTDVDCLYLECPTHMFSVSSGDEEQASLIESKMMVLHQVLSLQEAYEISPNLAQRWSNEIIKSASVKGLSYACREMQSKYKTAEDYLCSVRSKIEQAVGRTARTANKRKQISFHLDIALKDILAADNRKNILLSNEYLALVREAKTSDKGSVKRPNKLDRQLHIANLHTRKTVEQIKWYLTEFFTLSDLNTQSAEHWLAIRCQLLNQPTSTSVNHNLDFLYVQSPMLGHYVYDHKSSDSCQQLSKYRFFEGGSFVSESESGLAQLMKCDVIKQAFEDKGYATSWGSCEWIMNPVAFQALYKGALGEEAGEAILLHADIEVLPMPIEHFERFDSIVRYQGKQSLIDFKYWNLDAWNIRKREEKQKYLTHIINKANEVGSQRAIICNVFDENTLSIQAFDINGEYINPSNESAVVLAIPSLLQTGSMKINDEAIIKIKQWIKR
ncbi:hypothetical protein [Psychromonas marina]|uniref:hypothetical protein n=1 Tax=Psychromonas marina TaxID=88364 RepID=UPI0024E0E33B|nr:hypothetical protein [Psychromonas marina]